MYVLAGLRRPPGGGHFLYGLRGHPYLALAMIVILVAVALYQARRR